jgi:hypothetical protein
MTTFIPLTDASAQVLVKNLKSKIIACGPTINSSQIETILVQWSQASTEASKAAAFIETARQKTQETLIRIARDKLSPSEERLAQFLRRAVKVKLLRKAHLEIAQTELRAEVKEDKARMEAKALKAAIKTARRGWRKVAERDSKLRTTNMLLTMIVNDAAKEAKDALQRAIKGEELSKEWESAKRQGEIEASNCMTTYATRWSQAERLEHTTQQEARILAAKEAVIEAEKVALKATKRVTLFIKQ